GSLTLNSDGSFVYTPTAGFFGVDSFTYKFNNGSADSNVATVSIAVGLANQGMVAWYKLDDANGSSAADSSGNGYSGTRVNSPQWVTGIVGGALQFDGSSNYVAVPNSPDLGGGSFTLAAW